MPKLDAHVSRVLDAHVIRVYNSSRSWYCYHSLHIGPHANSEAIRRDGWSNHGNRAVPGGVHVCLSLDHNTILGGIAAINSIDQNTRHPWDLHLVTDTDTATHLR